MLAALFPDACELGEASSTKGAYILAIAIDTELVGAIRGTVFRLPAGKYLYCGSAYGPGGIGARAARHLRQEKPLRWHVDHLTNSASAVDVLAFPGGSECALTARLLAAGAIVPVPGFGSSDCRSCPAHLLRMAG